MIVTVAVLWFRLKNRNENNDGKTNGEKHEVEMVEMGHGKQRDKMNGEQNEVEIVEMGHGKQSDKLDVMHTLVGMGFDRQLAWMVIAVNESLNDSLDYILTKMVQGGRNEHQKSTVNDGEDVVSDHIMQTRGVFV